MHLFFHIQMKKYMIIRKKKDAIYCNSNYGHCFASNTFFIINIYGSIFKKQGNSYPASDSYYQGIISNYELNYGEYFFYNEEIEDFQIFVY